MQPKTAKQEIFSFEEEILAMSHSADVDRPRLANIRARILRLTTTSGLADPAVTAFLSVIANLLGEHEMALDLARNVIAMPFTGDHSSSYGFSAASSIIFSNGNYSEAAAANQNYLTKFPNDVRVLKSGIMEAHLTAQSDRVQELMGRLSGFSEIGVGTALQKISSHAELTKSLAAKHHFSDADILARFETAIDSIRARALSPLRMNRSLLTDGSSIIKYYVLANRDMAAELTFQIFDALAKQHEDTLMEILSFSCSPFEDYCGPGVKKDDL